LDAGGITLGGPVIQANTGGSPSKGSGARPILPGQVKPANTDKAGKLLIPAQRQALLQKKPLCAICEAAKAEARNA
ncbi:type VI secretion system tip protein VgrG, partial [Pseudomonas sp. AL-54]|nr:type VI secretion system tip protein VgrG [Pseudomonas lopnurensis]